MLYLPQTSRADSAELANVFSQEIAAGSTDDLPLQQGMAHGNVADGETLSAMVIRSEIEPRHVRIHAGLFFSSVVAGCACTNDPTPMHTEPEYCEAVFEIERDDGGTTVRLVETPA